MTQKARVALEKARTKFRGLTLADRPITPAIISQFRESPAVLALN
jgi:hypothetical protein